MRPVLQVSHTIISYSLPLCSSVSLFSFFYSAAYLYNPFFLSPFCSFPFSIPFFIFIFSQGYNTVAFRKERSRGKKTQFREINLPATPPLLSCCETLYINLRLAPLFTSLFLLLLPLLFPIVADLKLTEIRSGIGVKKRKGAVKGFGVIHNCLVRVRGSGKEPLGREDSI